LVWALVVIVGALLAIVDWRKIRLPVLGALLLVMIAGGLVITVYSPFNFGDGGYYMEGVLLSAGSALAFAGYLAGSLILFVVRLTQRKN
jgi:hypothetical protein